MADSRETSGVARLRALLSRSDRIRIATLLAGASPDSDVAILTSEQVITIDGGSIQVFYAITRAPALPWQNLASDLLLDALWGPGTDDEHQGDAAEADAAE